VLTAELARGARHQLISSAIGDRELLYPDTEEFIRATELLVERFHRAALLHRGLVVCRKLADAGAAAVMPLGAPIGSGLGICNPHMIESTARSPVPVVRCRHRHRLDAALAWSSAARPAAQHRGAKARDSADGKAARRRRGWPHGAARQRIAPPMPSPRARNSASSAREDLDPPPARDRPKAGAARSSRWWPRHSPPDAAG
jgi:hypothetical protein